MNKLATTLSKYNNSRGNAAIAAVIALVIMGYIVYTMVDLSSVNTTTSVNEVNSTKAFQIASSGMNYAMMKVKKGQSPTVTNQSMGGGSFSVTTSPTQNQITVIGTFGNAQKTITAQIGNFGASCASFDTSSVHIAGSGWFSYHKYLDDLKIVKSCNDNVVITHMMLTWDWGNSNDQIKEIELQNQDIYYRSWWQSGAASGEMIDVTNTTLSNNTSYTFDHIRFNDTIPDESSFTVTAYFADGSSILGSFSFTGGELVEEEEESGGSEGGEGGEGESGGEGEGGGEEGGGGGEGGGEEGGETTPEYQVTGGTVTIVDHPTNITLEAIGSAITCGYSGPTIPVKAKIGLNGSYSAIFNNQNISGGETYSYTTTEENTQVTVQATASSYSCNNFSYTVNSTNAVQVKTLVDGDDVPNIQGYGGQQSVQGFLGPYIENGQISIDSNQVIFLFELGIDLTYDPNSSAADFQDAVILLTVEEDS